MLKLSGATGEAGTTSAPISAFFPSSAAAAAIHEVVINGASVAFHVVDNAVVVNQPLSFPGLRLPRAAQVGRVPAGFVGGNYSTVLRVSEQLLDQLAMRRAMYPVQWTAEELGVGWLAPHRLLLFLSIVSPQDAWNVTADMDGKDVGVTKAYTSRHPVASCFQGWFLDLTELGVQPNVDYRLNILLPKLAVSQFKGLFLENIEPILVQAVVEHSARESRSPVVMNAAIEE